MGFVLSNPSPSLAPVIPRDVPHSPAEFHNSGTVPGELKNEIISFIPLAKEPTRCVFISTVGTFHLDKEEHQEFLKKKLNFSGNQ